MLDSLFDIPLDMGLMLFGAIGIGTIVIVILIKAVREICSDVSNSRYNRKR